MKEDTYAGEYSPQVKTARILSCFQRLARGFWSDEFIWSGVESYSSELYKNDAFDRKVSMILLRFVHALLIFKKNIEGEAGKACKRKVQNHIRPWLFISSSLDVQRHFWEKRN